MHEETAFLRGIEAAPDDAALRLAYADWLEELGETQRAECIRVEAAMAAVPVYSDRYQELKPRRAELRAALEPEWLRQMGYVPRHRPMFTKLPRKRSDRWRLVVEFIEVWYGPLKKRDGNSEKDIVAAEERIGFRLPAALREWHSLAGNRPDIWSNQDTLVWLKRLQVEPRCNALIFYSENQSCEIWGIRSDDLRHDDPPVYRFHNPARVSPSVSSFAIQVLLYEAKFAKNVVWGGGSPGPDSAAWEEIEAKFTACQLPERYWHDPVRLYEGEDLILETLPGYDELCVAARTEEAYQRALTTLGVGLERFT